MSQDLNLLVQGIVRKREESLPLIEQKLDVLNRLEGEINGLRTRSWGNRDVAASINELRGNLEVLLQAITTAKADLEQAKKRFSRKNLSIAIAGKARQGKSQMLQMLTGLTDEQIPTGGSGFCTAARSVIFNEPGEQYAEINYLPDYKLMESKIIQAYQPIGVPGQLGLSPTPRSVSEFIGHALPELKATDPSSRKFYDVLQELHNALQHTEVASCIGKTKERKSIHELRPYLTRDNQSLVPYFHVVENVEIHTPFEVGLPQNMKVFDLPGLGEMSPNIRSNMMRAVSEDADIVMLLRRPDSSGDDWREDDYQLLDDLKKLFESEKIQPSEWVALILNQDSRPGKENYQLVRDMEKSVPQGFQPIVCDCGNKEDVRKVIIENMTRLIDNANRIDQLRLKRCEGSYKKCLDEGKKLIGELKGKCSEIGGNNAIFDENYEEFLANLRGPFQYSAVEQLKAMNDAAEKILCDSFKRVYTIMLKAYNDRENKSDEKFPLDFPIFNVKTIEIKLKSARGAEDGPNAAVRNQLWAILHLLKLEMTKCCEEIKNKYLETMAHLILEQNPAMRHIVEEEDLPETSNANEKLNAVIVCMKSLDGIPDLIEALQNLVNVNIDYEVQILPYFHENRKLKNLDPLDLDATELDKAKEQIRKHHVDYNNNAKKLFAWMKNVTTGILKPDSEDAQKMISTIIGAISKTFNANYKNFVMQFIFGNTVETQWRFFAYEKRCILWRQAYEEEAQRSEFGKALKNIIVNLQNAVKESPRGVSSSEEATKEDTEQPQA